MPRSKRVKLPVFGGASSAEAARREIETAINELLAIANDPPPTTETYATRWRELNHAFTLLQERRAVFAPRHWPVRLAIHFDHLGTIVRAGVVHLGRCPHCDQWFFAKDSRRVICYRDRCRRIASQQRSADARARERVRSVTLKGTKPPR